jgi:hypothetical protein
MNIYDYQRPVGKIEDVPALRDAFIAVYDMKAKEDAVRFGLLYGKHIVAVAGVEPCGEIAATFAAMQRWLDGKANYHEARNIAFGDLYRLAREENDIVKLKFYKTMAQIACIPHVKYHALWATDFAVTLINAMHPGNLDEVKKERETQIALLESV